MSDEHPHARMVASRNAGVNALNETKHYESVPGSSVAEQGAVNSKVEGSIPSRAEFSGTWQIIVVRESLSGSMLFSQLSHAVRDAGIQWALGLKAGIIPDTTHVAIGDPIPELGQLIEEVIKLLNGKPPDDTRNALLVATKAQIIKLHVDLTSANVPHVANFETDGSMAKVLTAVSLVTTDRPGLDQYIGHLKPARMYKVADAP